MFLLAQAPSGSLQELEWGEASEGRARIIQQPQAKTPWRSVMLPSPFPESRWWKTLSKSPCSALCPLSNSLEKSWCTGLHKYPRIKVQTTSKKMYHWMASRTLRKPDSLFISTLLCNSFDVTNSSFQSHPIHSHRFFVQFQYSNEYIEPCLTVFQSFC